MIEELEKLRIIPRMLMITMLIMTYQVIDWFMDLPDPNPEQAALVSVMTGTLTASFGLFLSSGRKE